MKEFDAREFGAVGDGIALNTAALQSAIDALGEGDVLVLANGIYQTGTLALKSHMTLRIEPDAELCGSRNIEHYRDCGFYHNEMKKTTSLLYALDAEDIHITGGGRIQLSGDAFMDFSSIGLPREIDRATLAPEYAVQCVVRVRKSGRPTQPIFFNNCRNIRIDEVQIFNSPCWTLVFSNCDGVTVEKIFMDNHPRIPNNDGIHCSASRNITVRDSTLLCGDDCFAATCITNWEGVCEDIEISDCLMSSRSAALRFGHLSSCVRNACIRNVKVINSNRALILFARDGGRVENVSVEGLVAETAIYAGYWWGKGEGFVLCTDNSNGEISGVTLKNCSFTEENPSIISGEAGRISDVRLEDCRFVYRKGDTHPYYYGKLDLQPNLPSLQPAPFQTGDLLYVREGSCRDLVIK